MSILCFQFFNPGWHKLKITRSPIEVVTWLGGINNTNMVNYLQEPNVPAVGGSWIVDKDLVANNDWKAIRVRAAGVRAIVDYRNG